MKKPCHWLAHGAFSSSSKLFCSRCLGVHLLFVRFFVRSFLVTGRCATRGPSCLLHHVYVQMLRQINTKNILLGFGAMILPSHMVASDLTLELDLDLHGFFWETQMSSKWNVFHLDYDLMCLSWLLSLTNPKFHMDVQRAQTVFEGRWREPFPRKDQLVRC